MFTILVSLLCFVTISDVVTDENSMGFDFDDTSSASNTCGYAISDNMGNTWKIDDNFDLDDGVSGPLPFNLLALNVCQKLDVEYDHYQDRSFRYLCKMKNGLEQLKAKSSTRMYLVEGIP